MALLAGYTLRPVEPNDHKRYLQTLSVLTTVGDVSETQFLELIDHWRKYPDIYHPRVIADAENNVVATGMLLVEQKLIHGCGKVGHVEDIAVAETQQGNRLGNHLLEHLCGLARDTGCYKVILDCSEKNVGFYERCGLEIAGVEMTKRYD